MLSSEILWHDICYYDGLITNPPDSEYIEINWNSQIETVKMKMSMCVCVCEEQ